MFNKQRVKGCIIKALGFVLFITLLISTFSGCGGSKQESESNAQSSTVSSDEKTTEEKSKSETVIKGNLRFVYPGHTEIERKWSEELSKVVAERYPDIKIEYLNIPWADVEKKVTIMIQSNDYPDIIQTKDITNYVAMKALEPLDDYFSRPDSGIKKENIIESSFGYSVFDNITYAVPQTIEVFGMCVNVEKLAETGMKLEDLKTWEDVVKASKALTRDGNFGYGLAGGTPRHLFRNALIAAYSNDLNLADTSEASKKKYLELLEYYYKLKDFIPQGAVNWKYPDMFRAYCNEQVGILAIGPYLSGNVYEINPNIIKKCRQIPYPKGPSAIDAKMPVSNVGFGIFSGSKNKEAAWKVIGIAMEDKFSAWQSAVSNIPAVKSVTQESIKEYAKIPYGDMVDYHMQLVEDYKQIANNQSQPMVKIPKQVQLEVAFQKPFIDMITGKINPQQAYDMIKQEFDKIK